jgi:hypothetical protein
MALANRKETGPGGWAHRRRAPKPVIHGDLLTEPENSFLDNVTNTTARIPRAGVHIRYPHGCGG